MPADVLTCGDCGGEFDTADELLEHDCEEREDVDGGAAPLIADGGPYSETDREDGVAAAWATTHRNGAETHVTVVDHDRGYLVYAAGISANGSLDGTEMVAWTRTSDEARARADAWMQDNPRGIGGSGFLDSIFGGGRK